MKLDVISLEKNITKLASEVGGVLTIKELQMIINIDNQATVFNYIKLLIKSEVLFKFKRGFYLTKEFSPEVLSNKLAPSSYISMANILSKNGLIGTTPNKQLTCVKLGKTRTYSTKQIEIKFLGINKNLFFGFKRQHGINFADNEKAFLDILYFSLWGNKSIFNPAVDVDFSRLDLKKINLYLKKYRNPKFIAYCRTILNESK